MQVEQLCQGLTVDNSDVGNTFKALYEIACQGKESRSRILSTGRLLDVMNIVQHKYKDNMDVAFSGFAILSQMAKSTEVLHQFQESLLLEETVKIMHEVPVKRDAETIYFILMLMSAVIKNGRDETQQRRVRECGAIEAVLASMKLHKEHGDVQYSACRAINALVWEDKTGENLVHLLKSSVIEHIHAALVLQDDERQTFAMACNTLSRIIVRSRESEKQAIREQCITDGVSSAVIRGIALTPKSESPENSAAAACGLLANIASNSGGNKRAIGREGGVLAVINCLRGNIASKRACRAACLALGNIMQDDDAHSACLRAAGEDENQQEASTSQLAADNGALALLMEALELHWDDAGVASACGHALFKLGQLLVDGSIYSEFWGVKCRLRALIARDPQSAQPSVEDFLHILEANEGPPGSSASASAPGPRSIAAVVESSGARGGGGGATED